MRGIFMAVCSLLLVEIGCGSSSDGGAAGTSGKSGAASSGGSSKGGVGGGASGNSASGGSESVAGSGDAGSASEAGSGAGGEPTDCDCLGIAISWRRDGGRVPYRDESSVTPCNDFSYARGPNGEPPTPVCESTLGGCAGSFGVGDINAALGHEDVQTALAAAPVLYGADERPFDGQVRRIEIDGKVIEVGAPCGQTPTCDAIPDGVAVLAELLWSIQEQELAKPTCEVP